jgi:putative sporulation protein YyaC
MVQRLICEKAVELIHSAAMIDVICIGTPRVVGDSVGPRVGSLLKAAGLPDRIKIIGCTDEPVYRGNLISMLMNLRNDALLVCVDAALSNNFPAINIRTGPMQPGVAVSDELPKLGDVSVICGVAETIKELYLCSEDYINDIVEEAVTTLITILSA